MLRSISLLFVMLLVAIAGIAQPPPKEPTKVMLVPQADSLKAVSFTLDVLTVIDHKCLGCHSPDSRNDKAKEKMQWELVQNMTAEEALELFDELTEVLEEGKMPPEKMVERFPNMKLTDEESATLKAWAETTLTRLEE